MKVKYNKECPCGKINIKMVIETEEDEEELFCPLCTASLEEESTIDEEFDDD